MPSALRFPDGSYARHTDVHQILERFHQSKCVEITGYSNLGKSGLLRLLAEPDVWQRELGEVAKEFLPVYIDCNRMVEVTDQGIYELILRCLRESDPVLFDNTELLAAYEGLTAPASEFQIPLSFNRGITAAVQADSRKLVLLFDEFDEPFAQIDSRVCLNLRAKRDRYGSALTYATATVEPLNEIRFGDHCAEFCELFVQERWNLAPLTVDDLAHYVRNAGEGAGVEIEQSDTEFLYSWTGGHPGLLIGATHILVNALVDAGEGAEHWLVQRELVPLLHESPTLEQENQKIWQNCTADQKAALFALFRNQPADQSQLSDLEERHILARVEGDYSAFSQLFAHFIQIKHEAQAKQKQKAATSTGLWLDADSGSILIDGQPAETLTKLEYQLMTLLFDNADKIIDKYQIVVGVWGDEYIDEVDDARIEKLVSRLRQKIEPDPTSPRFITTVRGRGYRLVL